MAHSCFTVQIVGLLALIRRHGLPGTTLTRHRRVDGGTLGDCLRQQRPISHKRRRSHGAADFHGRRAAHKRRMIDGRLDIDEFKGSRGARPQAVRASAAVTVIGSPRRRASISHGRGIWQALPCQPIYLQAQQEVGFVERRCWGWDTGRHGRVVLRLYTWPARLGRDEGLADGMLSSSNERILSAGSR
jgi:hypothetical protein